MIKMRGTDTMLLTPKLDYDLKEPIYMQLKHYVVHEISAKRLLAQSKMPSVRELSSHLGISRNSVENAYNQLLAEGYIVSKERKGYYIADISGLKSALPATEVFSESIIKEGKDTQGLVPVTYDFKNEYVSHSSFDYKLWKRHLNYVLNYHSDLLYGYGSTRGEIRLRESIARFFYRTRGVVASPDSIVIGGGVSPLLAILVSLLNRLEINVVGMEDPGFNKAKDIFDYSHMTTLPIPVSEHGMQIKTLKKSDARACYVSPSHQYPTGFVMPIKNRLQLLEWAAEVQGYIIEDDYNSELRFEGRPIPAMQGMDQEGHVVYLGSFSTILAPAIRISFMVLPNSLNETYEKNRSLFSQSASKLEQLALSALIDSGDFDKHIKRIRKNYARKHQQVYEAIQRYFPTGMRPIGGKAGLQMIIPLPKV